MALTELYPISDENAPSLELYEEEGYIGGRFFECGTYHGTVSDNTVPAVLLSNYESFVVTVVDAEGHKTVHEVNLPKGLGQKAAVQEAINDLKVEE